MPTVEHRLLSKRLVNDVAGHLQLLSPHTLTVGRSCVSSKPAWCGRIRLSLRSGTVGLVMRGQSVGGAVGALRCHRHGQAVHEALEKSHGRCFRFGRPAFRDMLTRDEDAIRNSRAVRLLADQAM